jgi:hypothetical protein
MKAANEDLVGRMLEQKQRREEGGSDGDCTSRVVGGSTEMASRACGVVIARVRLSVRGALPVMNVTESGGHAVVKTSVRCGLAVHDVQEHNCARDRGIRPIER